MNKFKSPLIALAIAATSLSAGSASAADIKLSGFLNIVGSKHNVDQMRYLESVDDTLGFNTTNYGLNISANIDKKLSVAAQFIGGVEGENTLILEWGFATYRLNNQSNIKAGIVKYPGNLYSETVDVGFVYPWIRPPESIYSGGAELFFEAYKGVSYQYTTGDDTEISIEAYGGNTAAEEGEAGEVESHNKMYGVTLTATNDMGQVKLGYNTSILSATDGTPVPLGEDGKRYTIAAIGAEAEFGELTVIAEVAQSSLEDATDEDAQGWYVTFVYPVGMWTPHFTVQEFAVDDGSVEQSSMTLGVNRQIGNDAILKFEVQKVDDIKGNGFFEDHLLGTTNLTDGSDATLLNIALNVVF